MKKTVKVLFILSIILGCQSIGGCTKDVARATNSNSVNSNPLPWQLSADSASGTFAISGSYDNYNSSNSSGYHYFDTYVDTITIEKVLGDTVPGISVKKLTHYMTYNGSTYYLIYHDSLSSIYSGASLPISDYVSFYNHGDSVYENYNIAGTGPPGSYSYGSYMGHRIKK